MKNTEKTMDKIVALCKNRGIIFAGSEIYGGLANPWDYGPLRAVFRHENGSNLTDRGVDLEKSDPFCHPHPAGADLSAAL